LNGISIPGATTADFSPKESGSYTIKVTDINGCPVESDNYNVSILASDEQNPFAQMTAFPNPAQNEIVIGLPEQLLPAKEITIQLYTNSGQLIREENLVSENHKIRVDIHALPVGNYLIAFPELTNQKGIKFVKF
jgi:hypothetical protein